ncbi:MAG TPA: hypothetical protein VGR78_07355 [Verrucomicrobiae bacterium]|jgi:hypothetical protein|nr:hypothetical protein [Verrucomicrobiae bacterium]
MFLPFAALRQSDGALTLMAINKLTASTAISVGLTNFSNGTTANVWQLTNASRITHLPDASLTGAVLMDTLLAQSVTLFIIPAVALPAPPIRLSGANVASGQLSFQLTGNIGDAPASKVVRT